MSSLSSQGGRCLLRVGRRVAPLVLGGALLAGAPGCGQPRAECDEPPSACWKLASVIGPEDLVADPVHHGWLLVSSQDRRTKPKPPGAIWWVPVDPAKRARALALLGRDKCSFHPHGIDVVKDRQGRWLLYVINHHDASDRSPRRGCFPAATLDGAGSGPVTSIEVFEVEARRLRFLQRLADPAVLTHANDLVALPDGDLWVTDPPRGKLATLLDATGLRPSSKIDHFDCVARSDGRCRGTWKTAPIVAAGGEHPKIPEANGIAYRACPAAPAGSTRGACRDLLYVSAGAGGAIQPFEVTAEGWLRPLPVIPLPCGTNPDNLTWEDDKHNAILAAAHPDLRRFVQHSLSPEVPSPSEVVRVPLDGSCPVRIFRDEGGLISAASVALRLKDKPSSSDDLVVLGQVFDSGVFACRMPDSSGRGGQP